jgi:hypothetical protein
MLIYAEKAILRRFPFFFESLRKAVREEEDLYRKSLLFLGLLFLGIVAFSQESGSGGALSPGARELIKMAQAGVGESVLLTYVRTSSTSFALTAQDVLSLKAAGVPQSVISEALSRNTAAPGPGLPGAAGISQDQLFRLHLGFIFYQGRVYSCQNGLTPALQKILLADPAARVDIHSFNNLKATSHVLSWSGLGLVLGGSIYGMVAPNQGWSNANLNGTIAFGAIGAGLISAMISGIMNHSAYISLYDGLAQYNQDLIAQSSRR